MNEAAIRKLLFAVEHPPVSHKGISEAAFRKIQSVVGDLAAADPERFELPSRYKKGDANARRHIRFLSALLPREVPADQIPVVLADIINNPGLSPADVRDILTGGRGRGRNTPAEALRDAGAMLREGRPRAEVQAATGIDNKLSADLAAFLGVVEARADYLWDMAEEWLAEGRDDPAAFAREHRFPTKHVPAGSKGRLVQSSAEEQARALFDAVRDVVMEAV